MGYTLQAFVGMTEKLEGGLPAKAKLVALRQGWSLVPITSEVREFHDIPFCPLTDGGDDISIINSLAEKLHGKSAYLEAEFFGGDGIQAAIVWEDGRMVFGPIVSHNAINEALRRLGVLNDVGHDEFEALGLKRYDHTDDWVKAEIT